MVRKPDALCAGGCGKLLVRSTKSLPPGEAMCQPCRRGMTQRYLIQTCPVCGKEFRPVQDTATCSHPCGQRYRHTRLGIPPGGNPERKRAQWRGHSHRRRARCRANFDQVTPDYEKTLRTKARRCPLCKTWMTSKPYVPNSKELDHIVPLNIGGTHTVGNVRIICRLCNERRPKDGSDYAGPVTLWSYSA